MFKKLKKLLGYYPNKTKSINRFENCDEDELKDVRRYCITFDTPWGEHKIVRYYHNFREALKDFPNAIHITKEV